MKSIESKLKSFLKLIDQKNVEGVQKKVRVIEYPQIVWGGPHTNQMQTLTQKTLTYATDAFEAELVLYKDNYLKV